MNRRDWYDAVLGDFLPEPSPEAIEGAMFALDDMSIETYAELYADDEDEVPEMRERIRQTLEQYIADAYNA